MASVENVKTDKSTLALIETRVDVSADASSYWLGAVLMQSGDQSFTSHEHSSIGPVLDFLIETVYYSLSATLHHIDGRPVG